MELIFSRNLPEQSNIDRKQFIIGGDGLEMKTNLKVDRAPAPQLPIEKVAEHSGREECHRRGCAARQRHRGFFAIGSGWRRRQPCGELGHDRCGLGRELLGHGIQPVHWHVAEEERELGPRLRPTNRLRGT